MDRAARSYLDHNATSPARPAVAAAVARALTLPGNPSSVHAEGRAARQALQEARARVAALVGAAPERVVFTSGGTEAANTVLSGALRRRGMPAPTRLMISATEHACVAVGIGSPTRWSRSCRWMRPARFASMSSRLRLDACRDEAVLISVHAANNETGAVQPLAAIVRLARAHGQALVHSDAVQAVGKIPLSLDALGLDALTLSGHKFAAPKGVGALVLAEGVSLEAPLLRGGGQEARLRCGTENLPGIVGMGEAGRIAHAALAAEGLRLATLRDRLEAGVRALAPEAVVFGRGRAAAEHAELRRTGTGGGDRPDRPGSGRRGRFLGLGLCLGQGRPLAGARRDGREPRARRRGAAREFRLEFGRGRPATLLRGFERVVSSLYRRRGQAA